MPYESRIFAQDASTGRVEQTLAAVASAASVRFSQVDAAVAYATRGGVTLLDQRLTAQSTRWARAAKRFLMSIDFAITEPAALEMLAALPGAEVRIPNGLAVLQSRMLRPKHTFHTKAYMFRRPDDASQLGLVTGSANLTVSALAVGAEATAVQIWSGPLAPAEEASLAGAQGLLDWFSDAWLAADPLDEVLPTYADMWRRQQLFIPKDDRTAAVRAYKGPPLGTAEVAGPLAVQLASAKALWVKTDVLYENRGAGQPGNQLDTPRGTRVFFGFSAAYVPRNYNFGQIQVQVAGYPAVSRSVRFANNSMDKVNLPVPGSAGPPSYDNSYLVFTRDVDASGEVLYRLAVTDAQGLATRKAQAAATIDLAMNGGRPYGLLF